MELGIALGLRDFCCARCGRQYSRVTCDLILPNDMVCEECLEELGHPTERELGELLTRWKAKAESERDKGDEGTA